MAADPTYQTKRYHQQGGDVDVVASGGEQKFESGATQTYESGSIISDAATKTQTGVTTLSGAGSINLAVTAGSSGATNIPPNGIATVSSTGKAEAYTMTAAPAIGNVLHIQCNVATSTGTCTITAAAGVTFSSTAALRKLVFNTANTSATIFAVSATQYGVVRSHSTGVIPTST